MANRAHSLPPTELSFRVSPRTMRMLGRENISSPIISVLELVKNAYDADASRVSIIFESASEPIGQIMIDDDGEGMDLETLRNSWMVISTDNKIHSPLTKKGRRKVGEKGIGRLAMDRLAHQAIIVTHQLHSPGLELAIDWDKYEHDDLQLHEISHPLHFVSPRPDGKSGTAIYLTRLRDKWTRRDYQALYDDLSLLIPPFSQQVKDFSIYFECSDFPELSGEILSPMAEAAEFVLESTLDIGGKISHVTTHRSGEVILEETNWADAFNLPPGIQPQCGPLQSTIYVYLRDAQSLRETGINVAELRQFLRRFQGVRIYRDNFRVKPYGDPNGEGDWLGLNTRYTQTRRLPEGQIVGTVFITRHDNSDLQDQTNREGLIENDAYRDMRKFMLNGINFLDRVRQNQIKRDRKKSQTLERRSISESLSESEEQLTKIVGELRDLAQVDELATPQSQSILDLAQNIENVVTTQIKESETAYLEERTEVELQQTEYQLMIGLSTLGIATTAFGHEISRAINNIRARTSLLSDAVMQLPLPISFRAQVEKDLKVLVESANQIQAWGKFSLERVRQDKRTTRDINLNRVINSLLQEFKPTLEREQINITANLAEELPPIRAFTMDIEALLINFLTNAREAMRYQPLDQRKICISSTYNLTSTEFQLTFADSGRGIRPEDIDKIWDPLFSTKLDDGGNPIGTGLGLTIVKNIMDSYNGRIDVNGSGPLGGAEFRVYFPKRNRGRDINGQTKGRLAN